MKVPIVGPSYISNVTNFQNQKTLNWYVESDLSSKTTPAKCGSILKPTPGIVSLYEFGDFTSGRASIVVDGICYCIIDDTFMFLDSTGLPNYVDILNTSSGWVSMAPGQNGILIADGVHGYYYDLLTLTFSVIVDTHTSYPTIYPNSIVYLDGIYYMTYAGSQQVNWSDDPTDWPLLQFISVGAEPDDNVFAISTHEQIWFLGSSTTEVWTSTGDGAAPLMRYSGTVITKGCKSAASVVAANNTLYWLGAGIEGGIGVYSADGFTPALLSAPLNAELNEYTVTNDAIAFYHKIGYHEFYVLTFPTERETWAYDIAEGVWTQRASYITLDPYDVDYTVEPREHRVVAHAFADGTHYVLDRYTGAIAKYDENVYTEFDLPIKRQRTTSMIAGDLDGKDFQTYNNWHYTYKDLILTVLPGVGNGDCTDPVINLKVSHDGGFTWGPSLSRELGALGIYNNIVKWELLGMARDLVLDFQITDPVNAVIQGATVRRSKCSF